MTRIQTRIAKQPKIIVLGQPKRVSEIKIFGPQGEILRGEKPKRAGIVLDKNGNPLNGKRIVLPTRGELERLTRENQRQILHSQSQALSEAQRVIALIDKMPNMGRQRAMELVKNTSIFRRWQQHMAPTKVFTMPNGKARSLDIKLWFEDLVTEFGVAELKKRKEQEFEKTGKPISFD